MKKIILLINTLVLVAFASCTKNEVDDNAVTLNEQYAPLAIKETLKADKDSVNFSQNESVVFTAKWNKKATWNLNIIGRKSKSVRTYTGYGRFLDATTSVWNGTTNQLPMFVQGEVVDVLLNFPNDNSLKDTLKTVVKIIKVRNLLPVSGVLITDFETGNIDQFKTQSGGDSVGSGTLTNFLRPGGRFVTALQGSKFYVMGGRDFSNDYYIAALTLPASVLGSGNQTFGLPSDTTGLYFNCFIYGEGRANTQLAFGFAEDDQEPYNSTFNRNSEDQYGFGVTVDWVGWKLVSIPYNLCNISTNQGADGQNGNKIREPNRIVRVAITLVSVPNGGAAGPAIAAIDYPIFTIGKPLEY
jgi:hypothetical protein